MALVGGGGSPNVSGGSNPAGTGSGLNYIGNHCYAYSGATESSTGGNTMLNFTTGSEYIRAKLTCNPSTKYADVDSAPAAFQLTMDGQIVGAIKFDNNASDTGGNYWEVNMIIPPYTKIEVEMDSTTDDGTYVGTAILEGRVYA
jgi:hypothetical protein